MKRWWLPLAAVLLIAAWFLRPTSIRQPARSQRDVTLPQPPLPMQRTEMQPRAAGPVSTNQPPAPPLPAKAAIPAPAGQVLRLMNSAIPIEDRLAEIRGLASRADRNSTRILMELADRDTLLNSAAVEALGRIPTTEVTEFLTRKLASGDPQILAATVRSLARTGGAQAVSPIAVILRGNHRRDDGYQDTVCTACVEALGATGSPQAVPALAAELEETVGRDLQLEYGSAVVAALAHIGSASAQPSLLAYARRLKTRQAAEHNPLATEYLRCKISEVESAIVGLK